jgi:peptidoglycan/LPS O-acetylase OafA/YrhL
MARRIVQLDGIRAIAIATVFVNHAFQVRMLWMGVDLFFILSGFLITGVLIDHKDQTLRGYFGHFYGRRARRILPPYLLLLCVGMLLYGIWWLRHWYLYVFLMNFLPPLSIPRPGQFDLLWSLAVEEQFYLVWPFAVYLLSEKHLVRVAAGLMVTAPILRWACTPWFPAEWSIYMLTPFRMDTLAAGALMAIAWRKYRSKFERFGQYGLILSAVGLVLLMALSRLPGFSTHANTRAANVWVYEITLTTCAGTLLWALSGRGVRLLTLPPVTYIGRISYSLYLIHLVVIVEMRKYLHGEVKAACAAAVISLLYAACSWHFMEKPIIQGRGRMQSSWAGLAAGDPRA